MPTGDEQKAFAAHITELLQWFGPVRCRQMFGGFGLFLDGLMFGLVVDSVLYLKADTVNRSRFEEMGLLPFRYPRSGEMRQLSYYETPAEAIEDRQLLAQWAEGAFAAAVRAAAKRKK